MTRRQHGDEQEERPQLDALGQGAGDDRSGGGHENHLEEPVGHRGVAGLDDLGARRRLRRVVGALEQRHFVARRPVEQGERAEPAALFHADIHDVVADEVEHQPGYRVEADILEADDGRVLGADGARFQHRETGAHPHHQRAPNQKGKTVQNELRLFPDGGESPVRKEQQKGGHRDRRCGGHSVRATSAREPVVSASQGTGRCPDHPPTAFIPFRAIRHDNSCPFIRIGNSSPRLHPVFRRDA